MRLRFMLGCLAALAVLVAIAVLVDDRGTGPGPGHPAGPTGQVYADGLAGVDVPEGHVTVTTGVAPVAVLPPDLDPHSADLAGTIAELLSLSMYTLTGEQDLALELMHHAVLLETARAVHDHYDATLLVAYPPAGPDQQWSVTHYDPVADDLHTDTGLTRTQAHNHLLDPAPEQVPVWVATLRS